MKEVDIEDEIIIFGRNLTKNLIHKINKRINLFHRNNPDLINFNHIIMNLVKNLTLNK